ncbi:MAG: hypothetical protein AB1578_22825 [Thermodesulfobacteriota bacterium]|jgi:hypothetical protein
MANLTITVGEDTLRRARIRALGQGTSVNAVLGEFLETYAGVRQETKDALEDLLRLSQASTARRGPRTWTRDEVHERGP